MSHRFPATWSRSLRISTVLSAGLIAIVATAVSLSAIADGGTKGVLGTVLGVALLAVIALAWSCAPRAFALEGRELWVERNRGPPVRIPLAAVRAVAELPPGAVQGAFRIMGTGGMFGHYGRFRSGTLGSFRMYATRLDRLVAVRTADALFVLSPEPADRFVEAVLAAAPGAQGAAGDPGGLGRALVAGPVRFPWRAVLGTGAALGLLVSGVGLSVWSRAPRSIAVQGRAIVIERNRAAPIEIPLTEIRAVEPLPAGRLAGLRRTAGTRGFGAAWGAFWSPALGRFELQAIDGRGGFVLVRRDGGPLVVTPDDPDAFVAAARAGLAGRP